jgi:ubiquinone/menaquinone biosynthesis C-methylase UbiE
MLNGLQVTAILQAGLQLGVFDQIAAGNDQAGTVAAAIRADERGTRILLDALAALELLERDGDVYRLSPLADTFLVSSRPHYLGGMVDIFAPPWVWTSHQRLAEVVRHGGTLLDQHAETPEHAFWETFAPSSAALSGPAGLMLAELVGGWSAQREDLAILDVACGSGLVSLPLAAGHPRARTTLLDWANVLESTKDNIGRFGLHERTRLIEGDMFEVPLGGPYDLIIASHVFHHFSEEKCLELLRRLAGVLKADGRLLIHDFMTGPQPAQAPFPYLFSVRMLTWTREGQAYPLDTYRRLLRESGFAEPEVHASPGMPSQVLIAGPAAPE